MTIHGRRIVAQSWRDVRWIDVPKWSAWSWTHVHGGTIPLAAGQSSLRGSRAIRPLHRRHVWCC
jgi:hypothetical protein